jgi:hypothetical protein
MSAGESPARRGQSSDSAAPVGETERKEPTKADNTLGSPGPENGFEAVALSSTDPALLTRAVEQANAAAEAAMRAKNRSVEFGLDSESGRVTMLIREERNGSEVTRQIPPDTFLQMVERLQGFQEGQDLPPGTFFSLDG